MLFTNHTIMSAGHAIPLPTTTVTRLICRGSDFRITCPVVGCSKPYSSVSALCDHGTEKHAGIFNERDYAFDERKCPECDKCFDGRTKLLKHYRREHRGTKAPALQKVKYSCTRYGCTFTARNSTTIRRHLATHFKFQTTTYSTNDKFDLASVFNGL